MPIYDYECSKCGNRFSVLQPVSASRTGAKCPVCESTRTVRVMSSFSSGGSSDSSCSSRGPFT